MKRTETIQVLVAYCDICGEKCGASYTSMEVAGVEYYACDRWDEHDLSCRNALTERLAPTRKSTQAPEFVTIEQMIQEGSCTAAWASEAGYQWNAMVIGGDALAKRIKWLSVQTPQANTAPQPSAQSKGA